MYLFPRKKNVILINFALSKHLVRDDELLTDQRGSLAYVSPDVLSGKFRILFHEIITNTELHFR